jgi:hypothetical protein
MSVRLNVVLVQSPRMSGLQSEFNAELAIHMMGVAGLDLSIVASLQSAEATQTDQLLLSSFQNDLAVLDWREPAEMLLALREAGIRGLQSPHQLDPAIPPPPPAERRLYLVDLRRGDSPGTIAAAMRALLVDRRVVAVPLTIGNVKGPSQPVPRPASSTTENGPLGSIAEGSPLSHGDSRSAEPARWAAGEALNHPASRVVAQDEGDAAVRKRHGESELDALVDGVNDGDW